MNSGWLHLMAILHSGLVQRVCGGLGVVGELGVRGGWTERCGCRRRGSSTPIGIRNSLCKSGTDLLKRAGVAISVDSESRHVTMYSWSVYGGR